MGAQDTVWETETIFDCSFPYEINTVYKHLGSRGPCVTARVEDMQAEAAYPGEKGKFEFKRKDKYCNIDFLVDLLNQNCKVQTSNRLTDLHLF